MMLGGVAVDGRLLLHSMDIQTSPLRNGGVVSRRSEQTVILLDPRSGEYFSLDDVAGRVWELCDGSRTVGQIVDVIASEYDAPLEQIRADVLELLLELRTAELLAA